MYEFWNNFVDRFVSRPLQILSTPLVVVGLVATFFVGGSVFAWQKYGSKILQDSRFRVSSENIEITPVPEWIRTNVKDEVVRDGTLENLSIHDPLLVERVAAAFAVHSWVAEVRRVQKQTGKLSHLDDGEQTVKLIVELVYRRPIAMVEVMTNDKRGLVPVDVHGIILPTVDFSPSETRNYLRLTVPNVQPYGFVGTEWGDQRVHQAAQIADTWGENWQDLKLYRIVVLSASPVELRNDDYEFELQTKKGSKVLWGSSPGRENPGEASASEKIAQLVQYVKERGELDNTGIPGRIDLRAGSPPPYSPRTANLPASE